MAFFRGVGAAIGALVVLVVLGWLWLWVSAWLLAYAIPGYTPSLPQVLALYVAVGLIGAPAVAAGRD